MSGTTRSILWKYRSVDWDSRKFFNVSRDRIFPVLISAIPVNGSIVLIQYPTTRLIHCLHQINPLQLSGQIQWQQSMSPFSTSEISILRNRLIGTSHCRPTKTLLWVFLLSALGPPHVDNQHRPCTAMTFPLLTCIETATRRCWHRTTQMTFPLCPTTYSSVCTLITTSIYW